MKVCLHLYNGICFQNEQCPFAHSSLELHPNADFSQLELAWELDDVSFLGGVWRMKVWTVYEMANRRGPGAVYKYWAWYGGSAFGWPPRRTGGGSGLLGHCWHLASPRRFVFSFVYGSASGYSFAFGAVRGSSSSVALCVGSPSPMALRVGTPSPWCLGAGSPSLVVLCAGSPSLVALCAGSTSPSCLCVGTGLCCRSTSSCSVASACCWTVCSRPGVASFCEGLFFCVATQSCVSLCSLKRIFRFPLFTADQSGCSHALLVRGAFEVEPSMVSVTSPSEPVSIGVRASWLGFVGGLFPRFCLTSVSVLGFPRVLSPVWVALSGSCLGSISTLIPTWQFFCSVIRWSFVVRWRGTHLWVLAVASLLVAV